MTGGAVRLPPTEVTEAGRPTAERLQVEVRDPDLCPRFVGRWVSGVRVAPSPDRVQMRLLAAGQRPISNIVDASNYVMVELGKPIHTYDAAFVRDGRIIVRRAEPGERLETLDHVVRDLDPETLLIADPGGPIGIAGVMGGAGSEVGEATTEVIVESAIFDPVSIRRTAFRYALRSDASLRFEKGQESRLARLGADRTARLIAEWAGGEVAPGAVDTAPVEPPRGARRLPTGAGGPARRHDPRDRRAARSPGPGRHRDGARGPGHARRRRRRVEAARRATRRRTRSSTRPSRPGGATSSVEADITEEIIRVRGYELVPATLPDTPMPPYRPDPLGVRTMLRETLAGAGLSEVVTFALVAPAMVERFPARDDGAPDGEPEQRAGGPPDHASPTRCRASTRCCARA